MDYDTSKWAQKILLAIILGGLLSLVTAMAHAQQFTIQCDAFKSNDKVRCEMKGLTEHQIHWKTTIGTRVMEHEVGHVVYLTVDSEWRSARVYVVTEYTEVTLYEGLVRWNGKNFVFGRVT
jgi:hypothetical protein